MNGDPRRPRRALGGAAHRQLCTTNARRLGLADMVTENIVDGQSTAATRYGRTIAAA
jgi:hypothetical protein